MKKSNYTNLKLKCYDIPVSTNNGLPLPNLKKKIKDQTLKKKKIWELYKFFY